MNDLYISHAIMGSGESQMKLSLNGVPAHVSHESLIQESDNPAFFQPCPYGIPSRDHYNRD
ncbi:MAG TPA: hypothetical protein PK360_05160, partial [bacterium]|nr:hypothetical protein [bacterium]